MKDANPGVRGPVQGLKDLSEYLTEHPLDTGSFVRGLTVGVFVGAAIAGSAIWQRMRRRRRIGRVDTAAPVAIADRVEAVPAEPLGPGEARPLDAPAVGPAATEPPQDGSPAAE